MLKFVRFTPLLAAAAAISLGACAKKESVDNTTMTNDTIMTNDTMAGNGMAMSNGMGAVTNGSVMVGGAEMLPTKTIVENASKSADHTTLVSAVKAAGLVETLSGAGPFTVFAPTNAAFAKLPAGAVDGLMKPSAKADLKKVLTYHVVPGKLTAADIEAKIKAGGGKAELTTVQGDKLTAMDKGGTITLTDAKGGTSTVTQGDVMQSNGVVHVVDTVLMPK
jgi:uncharacterized surface protein with fasciclin (FAS1) repeats